jgi:hypothetical protein
MNFTLSARLSKRLRKAIGSADSTAEKGRRSYCAAPHMFVSRRAANPIGVKLMIAASSLVAVISQIRSQPTYNMNMRRSEIERIFSTLEYLTLRTTTFILLIYSIYRLVAGFAK